MDKSIYIITGPTAVGKTALAIQWALAHDAEIVSCDSLLFYRGMDIGTAKPTIEEQAKVPHHLIDISSVSTQFNVHDFTQAARKVVLDIQSRGKRVLVTGGSGFYLKSFYAPVSDQYEPSEAVRTEIHELEFNGGLDAVVERLKQLNPDGVGELDLLNPRRVNRALERCLVSGKSLLEMRAEFDQTKGPFYEWTKRSCLLMRSKESLAKRIETRTHAMLAEGLADEVRQLVSDGIDRNVSASHAIGYRETLAWLDSGQELGDLEASINQNTRRLVARQMKWFRNQFKADRIVDLDNDQFEVESLFGRESEGR
ncbi:tRNA (adenosine(37)-N6)-dimethylallyltransferase MiaA [Rubellicoccus peritrichatus]|uniref:tRNA dimethylallyltransferase n=1 Tax=Rubellicoccus peritrichatus TaxID=3080537 RepID=A0AAQ3QU53_9BACT|nr:tRNA (adenosine(37)-N6)-dimethylallyltransferase MiaA [Puniceicoccus sp. CR14]WOO39287.1 tRNA (adenosine(37)-N6)-dimethylallyltransferase MiaA [Puniceicoccus sp. CR14]